MDELDDGDAVEPAASKEVDMGESDSEREERDEDMVDVEASTQAFFPLRPHQSVFGQQQQQNLSPLQHAFVTATQQSSFVQPQQQQQTFVPTTQAPSQSFFAQAQAPAEYCAGRRKSDGRIFVPSLPLQTRSCS